MKKFFLTIMLIALLSVPAYASASTADLDLFSPNDSTDSGNYVDHDISITVDDNDDICITNVETEPEPEPQPEPELETQSEPEPEPELESQSDPFAFDTNRVAIQATTEYETIVQVWSEGGYLVLNYYSEEGRQLSVEFLPIPYTMEPGGRGAYTLRFPHPANANRMIVKAMLLDNQYRPTCQADEAHVTTWEPFYCGTPELEKEAEQSLISVEVH